MSEPGLLRASAAPTVRTNSLVTYNNNFESSYASMEEAFPAVDPGMEPLGTLVLVQFRQPKLKSKGGIQLPDEVRSTEYYNTTVAKVIAVGSLAFKSARTVVEADGTEVERLVEWPSGPWFSVGDFVWAGKHGGERFSRSHDFKRTEWDPSAKREETVTVREEVLFAFYKARDIRGRVTADPLTIKAFLD